jgi:hypothetical protein
MKLHHQLIFLLKTFRFKTFGKQLFHLGIFFQDRGLATLFLNNHNGLKTQDTLKMLFLFELKITFSMKIKFNLKYTKNMNSFFWFNLICKDTKTSWPRNQPSQHGVVHNTYTLWDYDWVKFLWEAHISINMICVGI